MSNNNNAINHRIEEYGYNLLDRNDQFIRRLETTKDGTLNFEDDAEIQAGGTVSVSDEKINWGHHRIQPYLRVNGGAPRSLGIYIPTAPGESVIPGSVTQSLELHDKTFLLQADKLEKFYEAKNGQVVTTLVKNLLDSVGNLKYTITPSSGVIKDPMVFEPNTSKLEVINTLLKFINYDKIWVDEMGIFQVTSFLLPSERPIIRVFERGQNAIHLGAWTRDLDLASVYNKVILVAEGSDIEEAIIGLAVNNDPNSEWSIPNWGSPSVYYESGVDAESPAIIQDLAKRKLIELSSPVSTLNVQHINVPIKLRDIVRFISTDKDVNAQVVKMSMTLTPGSLVSATWREVITL